MTAQTLPPGRKMCPGWTSTYTPGVAFECGGITGGRRRADPALVLELAPMCQRCRRQQAKWDEAHGAKADGLRQARAADVREAVAEPADLPDYIAAVDGLTKRAELAPFARRGEPGYKDFWFEPRVPEREKMNALRAVAGLPIEHERR